MKAAALGIVIANFVVATPECWSPSLSEHPGCSLCGQKEVNGTHCVHSGRSAPCYATADLCCHDNTLQGHIPLSTCLADVTKAAAALPDISARDDDDDDDSDSDSDSDDEDILDVITVEECQQVVSRDSSVNNRKCMEDCVELTKKGVSPTSDKSWSSKCMSSHWHEENGRAVPDGPCFHNWVYGYSEPANLSSYKLNLTTKTPAICQASCQEDEACVAWLWASTLYTQGTEVANRCLLKNKAMVDKSLDVITDTQPPLHLDTNFCNFQMGYSCQNLYNCLACQGQRRCVWESHMHLSGWKYCDHTDFCASGPTTLSRVSIQTEKTALRSAITSEARDKASPSVISVASTLAALRDRTTTFAHSLLSNITKH